MLSSVTERLEIYRQDIKVKKPKNHKCGGDHGGARKIAFFSAASRRRLLFLCRNSGHVIKSQFLLTYHNIAPLDGKIVKSQLNRFLTSIRKYYEGVQYIWVMEFQARGNPHIHLFLSLPRDPDTCTWLGKLWNKITGESEMHLLFHTDDRNMINWTMESGKYLAKQYLGKCNQKEVPEKFHNVGRFWGNSRSIRPVFDVLHVDNCPETKKPLDDYIKKIVKVITRKYEKILKKYGIKKFYRSGVQSYTLPRSSGNFIKYLEYLTCINATKQDYFTAEMA